MASIASPEERQGLIPLAMMVSVADRLGIDQGSG